LITLIVDHLTRQVKAMRGPGDSYSDVILRLAGSGEQNPVA
jgi:hypothetical protein